MPTRPQYTPVLLTSYSARLALLSEARLSLAVLEILQYAWRNHRCSAVMFESDGPISPDLERLDGG